MSRGSETRRRTAVVVVRLLPSEREALMAAGPVAWCGRVGGAAFGTGR